ncbi:MAG: alpha/beta fold hydrolase [Solirubrobacterales bacterium]
MRSAPRAAITGSEGTLNHVRCGSGDPLLLLHSLGGAIGQWSPVVSALAARRDVIAVDMPGFGASPALPAGIDATPQSLATAVLDFVDLLGLDADPGVAGISLGGWVAIECGRQGGASSVVSLCPAGFWREPVAPRRSLAYAAARASRPLLPLMRFRWMRRIALSGNVHHPERIPPAEAADMVRAYGGGPAYPEANRHMREGTVGDLEELDVPVTLGWAEFDQIVRRKPLKPGILPDSVRQVELPGCGHVPTWDDPELVARVILEGTS